MIYLAPADAGHLLSMGSDLGGLRLSVSRRVYSLIQTQVALSVAFAAFDAPDAPVPFLLAGLAPLPDGSREGWFLIRPGGLPGHRLLAVVKAARLILATCDCPVICCVRDENSRGQRLAQAAGFEPDGRFINGFQVWRLANVADGAERVRRRRRIQAGAGSAA